MTYIDFDYDPGFKFGIGADLMYDGWDTYVNYTWFANTHLKGEAEGPNLDSLYFNYGDSVSAKWNLYFNNIDWSLGRKFWISEKLTLHPHIGLKGAWLHQNFTTLEEKTLRVKGDSYANTYQKFHSWGIGLRAGLNTEWFVTKGLSIYGDLALAELYEYFHTQAKVIIVDPKYDILSPSLNQDFSSGIHQIRPVMELALGLRYETSFGDNDWYRFMIQAGWEQQIWWNQNAFLNNVNPGNNIGINGDLTFQGLDVKVGFAF